ncbi:MAG: glycosyltransferase family 9 protein [Bacteroidetes bacterium]|nr:glycosyltransferase family 9 protein [Bacteroidota bacterium]
MMNVRGKKSFKLLDKYLGVPILFVLNLFSKKKQLPKNIEKIGILTVPAIGDIILLNGFLRDIKKFNHDVKIILFVTNEVREIAEIMGSYDEIVSIKLFNPLRAIKTLRSHPVDVFIDTAQWTRLNAIFTFFSKSKYKIGFKTKGQYKHFIYDFAAEHSNLTHELYNFKKLSFSKEIKAESLPKIEFNHGTQIKKDQVVIHIMSGGYLSELKRWPDENWRRIIDYLLESQCDIYFTGSASDRKHLVSLLKNYKDNIRLHNVAGKHSLRETAILLVGSQLVISVDTGIMHLASALGCNLISLHGPTAPTRWGPLNSNSITIQSNYPEAPCLNLGFEYNCKDRSGECMKRITSEKVISEIKEFGL